MNRRSIQLENIALTLADITIILMAVSAILIPVGIVGIFAAHAIFTLSTTTVIVAASVITTPIIVSLITTGAEAIFYHTAMKMR